MADVPSTSWDPFGCAITRASRTLMIDSGCRDSLHVSGLPPTDPETLVTLARRSFIQRSRGVAKVDETFEAGLLNTAESVRAWSILEGSKGLEEETFEKLILGIRHVHGFACAKPRFRGQGSRSPRTC